ncbi:DEAD/DEAH box helicase [Croceibacter atlanticus]|uniref:ATP-dependent RNA helicase, DEAD/DEAH box family protein n=1 Tax=Croceibacter atlanticus (strain ATCC BAA-628 / JCM 21780 / CIP 108009 / IAM 15332 / KCTC 12090 / HTCC2559) TaxID=216432 RepID=A3U943_CROAH|nr:DEAD/DEAH box helicase [Croceibacter atlanticus]EAP86329.1 ATP-dependent RNA helicase, DEAD/DEAH box family protein [Croceibacter atlanticus HTCC2559]MBW4971198.1 DEAD/DEAH box helicase [Croceibacter atlanticus]
MSTTFKDLNLSPSLQKALDELGIVHPTPIQEESFPVIMSGRDVVGIAQTGTGKTYAYALPVLRLLPYSRQVNPRALIIVPTRELVVQVVSEIEKLCTLNDMRILGVYGGTNINTQKKAVVEGCDVLVATPGRLYDLAVSHVLQLKNIQKLVIDEVDVMLDLGFRFQLVNILDILPKKHQNILFSATMTDEVSSMISEFFNNPIKISVAKSGTPLVNIQQYRYNVPNYYTKQNLIIHLLEDVETYEKTLIFVPNKRIADRLFAVVDKTFPDQASVIHSNKTQNYRLNSIEAFETGEHRIMIATDVMARGLDIDDISHVINMDTPSYPENYLHRIGRTGRAEKKGTALVLTSESEVEWLKTIEELMETKVDTIEMTNDVEISKELAPEEQQKPVEIYNPLKKEPSKGKAFHEKKDKNRKRNEGGSYKRKIEKKYKKPKTRGQKRKGK